MLDRAYQLNVGGNMGFKNVLERDRLESQTWRRILVVRTTAILRVTAHVLEVACWSEAWLRAVLDITAMASAAVWSCLE